MIEDPDLMTTEPVDGLAGPPGAARLASAAAAEARLRLDTRLSVSIAAPSHIGQLEAKLLTVTSPGCDSAYCWLIFNTPLNPWQTATIWLADLPNGHLIAAVLVELSKAPMSPLSSADEIVRQMTHSLTSARNGIYAGKP